MRPKGELWQFTADTHITDWLAAVGLDYDVITDDALEREGTALLSRYACVVTGTHPEYYSKAMLDGVARYLDLGGRLVYLGANGFYWRIAWHPTLPGTIEHRRSEDGMRAWFTEPGESYMAATGEYSGLWQRNGRPPNTLVGVAFAAQGFDIAAAYRRTEASRDPRAAFIFAGVEDEVIGDFGSIGGGAAGWEIDRVDTRLGTPHHALVLAVQTSSRAITGSEFNHTHSKISDTCPFVRCDMVFFETPRRGGVSASSIWRPDAGPISQQRKPDHENVVRRFIDPGPFLRLRHDPAIGLGRRLVEAAEDDRRGISYFRNTRTVHTATLVAFSIG
jgi:N,N-dimethylformamidase